MASLVQEEMSFEERGQMVERIVQNAYDFFRGGLVAKWNRVALTWYEGGLSRYAIRIKDYFSAEPYSSKKVKFSRALQAFILTMIRLPAGITFDTLIDNDIPKDPRTGELNFNMERGPKSSLLAVVQRRFRDRLDGLEFSMRNDTPANEKWKMPVESRAPTPTPRDDRAYFEDTGFESVDLIEQDLKKIYRHGLEPVGQLTMEDKEDIRRHRIALAERNNGAYEAGKIVLKDRQINAEQEEIDWINAHNGMSEEEYVLALEKKEDKSDEDVAFLNKFCNDNGYNDWEDAYETLKIEDSDDEDMSGVAVLARAVAEKARLNQEKAELKRQETMTEEVGFMLDDFVTVEQRTYIGAYAIKTAHLLNDDIAGRLKRGARRANDERIPRLQAKLRFAMEFYAGIDQIFKDNDTVPSIGLWRENNYRSPLVGYVVWGMRNPGYGIDRLLFKPQATMVRRLIKTTDLPSPRSIQYMILQDRLTDAPITGEILEVSIPQANAYKDKIRNVTPTKQRPQHTPSTVEKNPKRKGPESKNPREQKPGGRKPDPKIQTKLTDGGFERGGKKADTRGSSRRAGGAPSRRRSSSPHGRSPHITGFFKNTIPFSDKRPGDKRPGDGKERARPVTPNPEEATSEEFKVKLKF